MRITTKGMVHQISFLPSAFPVNMYLVEEEEDLTLVDTGVKMCHKGILKTAEEIGKPIKRIIVTHAHSDHAGGIDELKKAIPGVEFLLPERELKLWQGDKSLESGEGSRKVKGGIPKGLKSKPDFLLKDGDKVGSLLAISSPGHTPGHMALFDERSRTLLAGDAFQVKGGLAVAGDTRRSFPFPAMATWDFGRAIKSAEKLTALKPYVLGVGHGDFLEDPVEDMRQVIERAKQVKRKRS
ncbi:MBL fold metallo-hydrolase [Jeotgalibacillus aurantiacus]|uniref:MBL fold metallo-hydrolase n=1 Tax=Jeotgalibacillus aurantiacus TaxID=2763266 RepID=UPI001D09BCD1|nr:MBL fold metallo-hydrolase [Jeotgalibacillus aurantiacus]